MTDNNWESLEEELNRPVREREEKQLKPTHTKLSSHSSAGIEWDGTEGELRTGVVSEEPSNWDDLIRSWGYDPAEVEVVEPVRRSSWEAQTLDGIQILHAFRAQLRRKLSVIDGVSTEKLYEYLKSTKPKKKQVEEGEVAFVVCTADTQIGKDPRDVTIKGFAEVTAQAVERFKELRKRGVKVGAVYLLWPGDCIENVKEYYRSQEYSVKMNLVDQIELYELMVAYQIEQFAPHCSRVVVAVVPGNHDEASRSGGKNVTDNADSFAILGAKSVARAFARVPAYNHVKWALPEGQNLWVALDICGTPTLVTHGHQFSSAKDAGMSWWKNQSHNNETIAATSLLISGHKHHLQIERPGKKTAIQLPAMEAEGGSQWWIDKSGEVSRRSTVTFTAGQGLWNDFFEIYP